jgi:hypothetical protein
MFILQCYALFFGVYFIVYNMKAFKIMQGLKPTDKFFKLKVELLSKLILEDYMGHIIDEKLVGWAKKCGFDVELQQRPTTYADAKRRFEQRAFA